MPVRGDDIFSAQYENAFIKIKKESLHLWRLLFFGHGLRDDKRLFGGYGILFSGHGFSLRWESICLAVSQHIKD